MKANDLFSRLEKIYKTAEENQDIRSMIRVSELMYKIHSGMDKEAYKAIKLGHISNTNLEKIIAFLGEKLDTNNGLYKKSGYNITYETTYMDSLRNET